MNNRTMPSEEDFRTICRDKIMEILELARQPMLTQELANLIQRPIVVTERYCDRLYEDGKIQWVRIALTPNFGWLGMTPPQ